ncbi:hypothetical protein ATI02_1872 [Pseudomonas baetica]|uniref:Uncharacterized protein n=1 Tax=Pseudomonas baetica TaxID=674054 RepID=A0ABX4PVF9_9PSED|nr:hypothetical protein [Pseudomonas baetica]PKA69032.1 hypothetical protein ATI02_1848 [Pseudomonas baetica]PKA69044.1 hypothetical protein ATI02_1860 [Pseudomonas baetica]PKA69054.1 hypothetical protein ATI02_1872 [Pseudomonas baetica]PTC21002.1 hypothetical protein C0J26_03315 [Pseudomonas baetica]
MLKMWFFIMLIEGKVPETFASDSEAHCKESMAKMLMIQRIQGQKATGACYVRASTIEDTEKRLIGKPETR